MDTSVTSARSILDKPLSHLTEEDISQLTREDCRKYLKEKGMRRPSWNKSQAIQQVISLKALLETSEDSGAGALRKILVTKPVATSISADSAKEPTTDANNLISVSVDDFAPCRKNDSPKSVPPGPLDCPLEEADITANCCRNPKLTDDLIGQMTIFYCGKVNVYDAVPPDKAQAILHLAACPLQSPSDDQICRPAFLFPYHLQTQSDKHLSVPSNAAISVPHPAQREKMTEYIQQFKEKGNLTHEQDLENQMNRKLSLQRYREKKKDRCKLRKNTGSTSSSMEVYVNHHAKANTSNEQSTRSSTSPPPHPVVPQASADVQMKISFSVDLNEDVGEL